MPHFELPKHAHPDLVNPHRKPVGPVSSDTEYELFAAKNTLVAAFLRESDYQSLYTEKKLTPTGTVGNKRKAGGLYKTLPGGAGNYITLSGDNDPAIQPEVPFSVFAKVYRGGALSSFSGILAPDMTANTGGYLLVGTVENKVRLYIHDGSSFKFAETDNALPLNKETVISGSWDGATVRIYQDGKLQSTSAAVTSINYSGPSTQSAVIGAYPIGHPLEVSWNGGIAYVGITPRNWSSRQHRSFYENQYDYLKPQLSLAYSTPEDLGGGPTFQAAWAMASKRSNVIGAR